MEKSTITISRELLETACMLDGGKEEIIEILKGVGDVSILVGDDKVAEEAEELIEYIKVFASVHLVGAKLQDDMLKNIFKNIKKKTCKYEKNVLYW